MGKAIAYKNLLNNNLGVWHFGDVQDYMWDHNIKRLEIPIYKQSDFFCYCRSFEKVVDPVECRADFCAGYIEINCNTFERLKRDNPSGGMIYLCQWSGIAFEASGKNAIFTMEDGYYSITQI